MSAANSGGSPPQSENPSPPTLTFPADHGHGVIRESGVVRRRGTVAQCDLRGGVNEKDVAPAEITVKGEDDKPILVSAVNVRSAPREKSPASLGAGQVDEHRRRDH